jgi:hypothetical protein
MPFLPALSLPPLRNWQDFEDLCCDLWRGIWNNPDVQRNGRDGQAQKGVDIYGRPDQGQKWAGVQCKLKNPLVGARLSPKEIQEGVAHARQFQPQLSRFVIATTSPRDSQLQAAVRQIDEAQRKAGSFSVTVFFWEDIVSSLGDFPDLLKKYYPQFFFLPLLGAPRDHQGLGANAYSSSKLEVVVEADDDLNYVALLPAFSSVDPTQVADLTILAAGLSVEVINHDDKPTEIQRLWLGIKGSRSQSELTPREIKEEVLDGNLRIEARSRRQYDLKFTAVFEGAPRQEWRRRVVLRTRAIGLGELQVRLEAFLAGQSPSNSARETAAGLALRPSAPARGCAG